MVDLFELESPIPYTRMVWIIGGQEVDSHVLQEFLLVASQYHDLLIRFEFQETPQRNSDLIRLKYRLRTFDKDTVDLIVSSHVISRCHKFRYFQGLFSPTENNH